MFVHSVYFWLEPDLTGEQSKAFKEALRGLKSIPSIKDFHLGVPALINRPVVDRTYDFALVIKFEDRAGQDLYQNHPQHQDFLGNCAKCWRKILVYDSEE